MGLTLAEVLRRFAPAYQQRHPKALLPSHRRALHDILACRTPAMGGHLLSLTAQTILEIAGNPRHLGAMPGIMAVLHSWTSTLSYHPHVHCLVTGGGVSLDHQHFLATRPGFFLPVRVLSRHLRHLFQRALQRRYPELYAQLPQALWQQEWVLHCVPWGQAASSAAASSTGR